MTWGLVGYEWGHEWGIGGGLGGDFGLGGGLEFHGIRESQSLATDGSMVPK